MSSASSGPLVFWRETGEGRRGLACHVRFCDNPECSCQEAFVQAFEVDERFHSIVSRGETLELRHLGGGEAPPSRKASAVIDLASGRFQSHREEAGGEAELQTWLRDAIDDKALSDLRTSWSAFKAELLREEEAVAKRKWKERDWSLWDGEEPIAWAEIVAEAARERYRLGERTYEARDCYCIRPGCECDSITIRFTEDSGDWLGEVFLDASTGEVTGTENRPGAHRVLLDLFDRYESRNDLASFSRRAEEMTRIGPEIHALRRQRLKGHSGGRIGRNERCPCGSGKKFKNCCGC